MATALTRTERTSSGADAAQSVDNLCDQQSDTFEPDSADRTPLCGEEEFAALVENMVADEAPRVFAVVQEYGQRVDGVIAAWGMAFDDHAEVVSADGRLRIHLREPQHALRRFHVGTHIRARLVWFNPNAVTPAEHDEAV